LPNSTELTDPPEPPDPPELHPVIMVNRLTDKSSNNVRMAVSDMVVVSAPIVLFKSGNGLDYWNRVSVLPT